MRTALVTLACVATLGLVACQSSDQSSEEGQPGAADSAAKPGISTEPWVKAPALGNTASPFTLDFELSKAPVTGEFAAVRLRWQTSQPQAATRWTLQTEGALERGAAPAELSVPALAPGQPFETTLQLRAASAGFGEVHLHPMAAGAEGGWAIPVWVTQQP